jgi:hypothetical protein
MNITINEAHLHLQLQPGLMATLPEGLRIKRNTLPQVGQMLEEQRGIFLGLFPDDNGGNYGLILPTGEGADLGNHEWGLYCTDVPGATSNTDGLANTRAMADAGSEVAKLALAAEVDGLGGLYIPSRHEARLAYLVAADRFDASVWHLTSTQRSARLAWTQHFGGGLQDTTSKSVEARVRLVRRFTI